MVRAADSSSALVGEIQPGDIFACFGADAVSQLISYQTSLLTWAVAPRGLRLSPSHVAIACPRYFPNHDRCWWFESTTLVGRRCVESGETVSGVQVHAVGDRLVDYCSRGRVDLYRLTPINALSEEQVHELRSDLIDWFVASGVRYDMPGAVFSGTRVARSIDKVTGWLSPGIESVFCSQLIAALLMSLCRMNHDNPQRYNPGRLLRTLIRQGTYRRVGTFDGSDLEALRNF